MKDVVWILVLVIVSIGLIFWGDKVWAKMEAPADIVSIERVPGCYQYTMVTTSSGTTVMAVDTVAPLTKEKDATLSDSKAVGKGATDAGKTVWMALMDPNKGVTEVAGVVVQYRRLIISIYPYPGSWDGIKDTVLDKIDKLLCGKK
jgi:hypothetical protein